VPGRRRLSGKTFYFVELLARLEALGRRGDIRVKETTLTRPGDITIELMSTDRQPGLKDIFLCPGEFQLGMPGAQTTAARMSRACCCGTYERFHSYSSTNIIAVYVGRCVARSVAGRTTR